MSRLVVEYFPPISMGAKKVISDDVTPSMISNDETSCQYEIDQCLTALAYYDEIYQEDIDLVNKFINEGVHYLEF